MAAHAHALLNLPLSGNAGDVIDNRGPLHGTAASDGDLESDSPRSSERDEVAELDALVRAGEEKPSQGSIEKQTASPALSEDLVALRNIISPPPQRQVARAIGRGKADPGPGGIPESEDRKDGSPGSLLGGSMGMDDESLLDEEEDHAK